MHRTGQSNGLRRALVAPGIAVIAVMAACGGAGGGGAEGPPKPAEASGPAGAPARPAHGDDLAQMKVYDEHGQASKCAAPAKQCADTAPDRTFLDHCRLAGFQIRQCGCETRCTGDVTAALRHYDEGGHPKDCAPANAECAPPASAKFQDACADKGFRLDVCGCEWLCSGNFMK